MATQRAKRFVIPFFGETMMYGNPVTELTIPLTPESRAAVVPYRTALTV